MRGFLALFLGLTFPLIALSHSVGTGSAQEVATPAPSAQADLAAMTLTPSDLDGLGLSGLGLANVSSLRDAKTDAVVEANGDALEAAERLAAYQAAGFRHRYVGSLLRPRVPLVRYASGLVAADLRVTTSVTEYASEAGAVAGFAFEGRMEDRLGQDVPSVQALGDQSKATRSVGTEPESGESLQRLDLVFQYGQLVGEVTLIDYRNAEPELTTVERLAEALLARIGRVQEEGGASLSTRALRLTPIDVWIEDARLRDFYTRQGGMDEPTFGQLAATVREDGALPTGTPTASSGVTDPVDTYMFWTPVGDGDPYDLPLYVVWLDRYRSAERADAEVSRLSTDLGPGYIDVHEFLARERIGDQSRHFAYRFEGDPSGVVSGHLVVARVGNIVVRTQVDGPQGVQAAGVEDLAAAQVECLRQEGECLPMPYLEALAALVAEPTEP